MSTESTESAAASRGECGTLTLLYWQAPSTMNVYLAGGGKEIPAVSVVLEPLARYDETGRLVPWPAQEIPTLENGGVSQYLRSITWNLQIEPQILSAMQGAGDGKVVSSFGTTVERLTVNLTDPDPALSENRSRWTPDGQFAHPFLTDRNVRKALSMAIDREAIASQLYGSAGKVTCNLLSGPPIYVSTANGACLTQDIDGANALLDQAGWLPGPDGIRQRDGVRLSILYQTTTNLVRHSTQAMIKQWWSQIGVETELRDIDAAVFFGGDPASPDTYGKFHADVQMYAGPFHGTDPERFMAYWVVDEIPREANQWLGINAARWTDPAYDALVAEFAQAADPSERIRIAKAQNDMLVQSYVEIPLVHRGDVSAHANSLLGVRMNSYDSELWNIADWRRADWRRAD